MNIFNRPIGLKGDTAPYNNIISHLKKKASEHTIYKIAYHKCGNGKVWLVGDTQSEARVCGISYCFPHAFRTKEGRGKQQTMTAAHNKYTEVHATQQIQKKLIRAYARSP